jgi:hypothetical protein
LGEWVEIVVQHDVEVTCTNFLGEHDMWSLVGENPKEMVVLKKHNTKVSYENK